MPPSFKFRGRSIETDRFLVLHEEVEKTLIDRLGLHYLHAHQIATRAEQAAVRAAGISWRAYDRFMQKYVKHAGDERLSQVPADLDTKPYRDEHDVDLLRRMMRAVERGHVPPRAQPRPRSAAPSARCWMNFPSKARSRRRRRRRGAAPRPALSLTRSRQMACSRQRHASHRAAGREPEASGRIGGAPIQRQR